MDLLDGYGSDDSSEGDTTDRESQRITKSITQPPLTSSITKHGKRLISLHAVLPPHLFDMLTKGGDDSDDDDDEPTRVPKMPEVKPSHHNKRGADAGLTSLLSELGCVPKTAGSDITSTTTTTTTTLKPEKMGLAFLQAQTSVLSRANQAEVLDVHKERVENIRVDDDDNQIVANESVSLVNASKQQPPISRVHLSVPRPSALRTPVQAALLATTDGVSDACAPYTIPEPEDQNELIDQSVDPRLGKKKSRREIEKALRSGDLDAVDGSVEFQTLDTEPSVYVLDQPATTTQNRSGVRIAPVAMYDTKAGKDVLGAGVSGKAKSKNQINFLMASAAAFEANEAQKTRVKTQRANAKRKYGW